MPVDNNSNRIEQCELFSDELQATIPTNILSRDALAELIGNIIEYHTAVAYSYDEFTLTIEGFSASRFSVSDIIDALNVTEWDATESVSYGEQGDDYTCKITFTEPES